MNTPEFASINDWDTLEEKVIDSINVKHNHLVYTVVVCLSRVVTLQFSCSGPVRFGMHQKLKLDGPR